MREEKYNTLIKNKLLINKYYDCYNDNDQIKCDILSDDIGFKICSTKDDIQKWKAFVHLTTSLPWKGAVGRQIKVFVYCGDHILGMIHLVSPMAHLRLRDEYLKFSKSNRWQQLNRIFNIETCVPTRKYSNMLTGKLLVYIIFSRNIYDYIKEKYSIDILGFETTSLYGKSSMYNRIPFLKYLGLTDGYSAIYISDDEWKRILEEYYTIYPKIKTNRLAPVKYQIIDKLEKSYRKKGITFPYKYKSENFKRGIYFGYSSDYCKPIMEAVNDWRIRWLIPRLKRTGLIIREEPNQYDRLILKGELQWQN